MSVRHQSESIIIKDGDRAAIQSFPLPDSTQLALVATQALPATTGPRGLHYRFESDSIINVSSGKLPASASNLRMQANVDEYFYVPENTNVNVFGAGTLRLIPMLLED